MQVESGGLRFVVRTVTATRSNQLEYLGVVTGVLGGEEGWELGVEHLSLVTVSMLYRCIAGTIVSGNAAFGAGNRQNSAPSWMPHDGIYFGDKSNLLFQMLVSGLAEVT